jgi:hypothetical protein
MDFFDKTLWQEIVVAFAAVVMGIPAGLYLQGVISSRGGKQKRDQLRAALKRALDHNLGTLQTVRDQLANKGVPTLSLDLALLDATAHTKYEVLNDIPLCASIDHLRFELAHLDRQLDALLRLELDAAARAEGNFVEGRKPSLYDQARPQPDEHRPPGGQHTGATGVGGPRRQG